MISYASLSWKRKGIIHPHLNPLINGRDSFPSPWPSPSREREIKELDFHRERKIEVMGLLRAVFR